MRRGYVLVLIISLAVLVFSNAGYAVSNMSWDPEEQLDLAKASQEMVKEEKRHPSKRFAMYAIWVGPEYDITSLGAKLEFNLLPTDLVIVIEGFELERGKPTVSFLSLLFAPFHYAICPYVGAGVGTLDEEKNTRYQLFVGAEIGSSFFIEVKYLNTKEINTAVADIHLIGGIKISL